MEGAGLPKNLVSFVSPARPIFTSSLYVNQHWRSKHWSNSNGKIEKLNYWKNERRLIKLLDNQTLNRTRIRVQKSLFCGLFCFCFVCEVTRESEKCNLMKANRDYHEISVARLRYWYNSAIWRQKFHDSPYWAMSMELNTVIQNGTVVLDWFADYFHKLGPISVQFGLGHIWLRSTIYN